MPHAHRSASRMESHGVPGSVHISGASRALIKVRSYQIADVMSVPVPPIVRRLCYRALRWVARARLQDRRTSTTARSGISVARAGL